MNELVRFGLDDGGSVIVEIASSDPGIARASRASDAIRSAAASFDSAMGAVRDAAFSALRHFRDIPQQPDEVMIEFGVELNAQVGAVIAQTTATAHLQVTLAWRRAALQPDTGEPVAIPSGVGPDRPLTQDGNLASNPLFAIEPSSADRRQGARPRQ